MKSILQGFAHPAPLIEENIQEETQSPKLKKVIILPHW